MASFEPLTEARFAAAAVRRARQTSPALCAVSASYDPEARAIDIRLNNGVVASIPIELAGVGQAAPADLQVLVIEGRGYGLRIPALDIDLSIPILFEEFLGGASMKRAQSRAAASSRNGKLGGRPRKDKAGAG